MDSLTITKGKQGQNDKDLQADLKQHGKIPRHIAIIMDGNGRWAKSRGNMRIFGHRAGVESVRDITESSAQLGVEYLTLYTFSTENWNRPMEEVNGLMKLLVSSLRKEAENLNKNDIKLSSIGQLDRFPQSCIDELEEVKKLTADNTRLQLNLALSYSGRWDITQATRQLSYKVSKGELDPDQIDEELLGQHLTTASLPDPDLLIRTSGELRISNFLLWQIAYSEMYITDYCWPDFRRNQLYEAIRAYQNRERRFGKISEQMKKSSARQKESGEEAVNI